MIFASLQGLGEDFKGCQSSGPGTQPVYTGESEADFCPADGSTLLSPAFVSHFRDLPLAVPIIPNATDPTCPLPQPPQQHFPALVGPGTSRLSGLESWPISSSCVTLQNT